MPQFPTVPHSGATTWWSPLKVYAHYRWVLSALLLGLFIFDHSQKTIADNDAHLYFITIVGFFVLTSATITLFYFNKLLSDRTTLLTIALDLFFIIVLAHFSGGITQNLSILMVVTVAAGNILFPGKKGLFVAAVASLLVLAEGALSNLSGQQNYIESGLLGTVFFATSFLAQNIARLLGEAQTKANIATAHVADLKNLNHLIIQRMQTGILVVDTTQQVQLINPSACRLLGIQPPSAPLSLTLISKKLSDQVTHWLAHQESSPPFHNNPDLPEIKANMARNQEQGQENILIFLDDYGRLTQQAQLLKLKSLARLTASIAHEIRNPLGAISHAAQLLHESPLPAPDLRLTEIIKQHSTRVNGIIENVLQLSRRQSPQLTLINLSTWLEKFIQEYKLTQPCQIDLIPAPAPWQGQFDTSQLMQVLHNLCDNGLRYSQRRTGIAHLVFQGGATSNGLAFLEIQDDGPDISPTQKEHLFEPFYTSEPQGTGLGLFLAKELCEINHASLTLIHDKVDKHKGCCFRITFVHPQRVISSAPI